MMVCGTKCVSIFLWFNEHNGFEWAHYKAFCPHWTMKKPRLQNANSNDNSIKIFDSLLGKLICLIMILFTLEILLKPNRSNNNY